MRRAAGALDLTDQKADVVRLLLLLVVALAPLDVEVGSPIPSSASNDTVHRIAMFAYDLPGLALVAVLAWPVARQVPATWRRPVPLAALILCAATVASGLVHPSWRGLQTQLRLAEAVAVAVAVVVVGRRWPRPLLGTVAACALLQSAICVGQVIHRDTLGLTVLGEHPPLFSFPPYYAGNGTFTHPYLLAGFSMVCALGLTAYATTLRGRPQLLWALAAAGAAVPLGLTFSRMSVLGLAVALVPLAVVALRDDRYRIPVALVAAGALVAALSVTGGWLGRASQSTEGSGGGFSADALSTGRVTFAKQSFELIGGDPLVGVGPGRYGYAVARQLDVPTSAFVYPVHDVPLLITAEVGVVGGAASLALLVALGVGATRRVEAFGLYVAYLPFLLLDWPYGQPQGVIVVAAWVGATYLLSQDPERGRSRRDVGVRPRATASG